MNAVSKTATFVRDVTAQNGSNGTMQLWRMDPPHEGNGYVITSAVTVPFSGPETYIFPATPGGDIGDWGELDGSFKGGLDHTLAIEGAGYTIADVLVVAETPARKAVGA